MTEYQLHPLAEEEMNEAARFYEARVSGLGDEFLDEFERCAARIVSYSESGQRVTSTSAVYSSPDFRSRWFMSFFRTAS